MKLNDGLIVSCQALKGEPMYGGDSTVKFAYAAYLAGAKGIRANSIKDINRIAKKINHKIPIIGIIKKDYEGSEIYITPTLKEVKKLIKSKCDVIALDATYRDRPNGVKLEELVNYIRNHSKKLIMADCSTLKESIDAIKLGFDYVSSTLRSYTKETKGVKIPDIEFTKELLENIDNDKVIFEGGIDSPLSLKEVLNTGVKKVVIGGAITRPLQITKRYLKEFEN
ncbi:MAG: N-acetylmannosamine-6-phosphate 2-epimerase [Firmicutes bacterium]|uniref:Putative N-acetylmannosamine-6-phosphate 2-epimerase n=1 Tax=Candidatus Onthovivens merdipullorum TaxID=2840889 RepID=A0A9D9GXH9_9BACL|nr:N-acetylmannosamine-6-phosphate 2-epimerase [Candidatus Onthovivens merdipullorum]